MKKILVIKSSLTNENLKQSVSNLAVDLFVSKFLEKNNDYMVECIDLNDDKVGSESLTKDNFQGFFNDSETYIEQLKNADKVVIGAPLINSLFPATLKNYIDRVSVVGKTFKYSKEGELIGLIDNTKLIVIATAGGPAKSEKDLMHAQHINEAFGFMGVKIDESILIHSTNMPKYNGLPKIEIVNEYENAIHHAAMNF